MPTEVARSYIDIPTDKGRDDIESLPPVFLPPDPAKIVSEEIARLEAEGAMYVKVDLIDHGATNFDGPCTRYRFSYLKRSIY